MDLFFELRKLTLKEGEVIDSSELSRRRDAKSPPIIALPDDHGDSQYVDQSTYDDLYSQFRAALSDQFGDAHNRIEIHTVVRNYITSNPDKYVGYDPQMPSYFLLKARDHETRDMIGLKKIPRRSFKRVYEQYVRENPEIDPNEAAFQVMMMYLDSNYQMDFIGEMDTPVPDPVKPQEDDPLILDSPLPDNVVSMANYRKQ